MRKKYLVVKEVGDSKGTPASYIVFAVAELDERVVKAVEAVTLDEQTATGIRQVMRQHAENGK